MEPERVLALPFPHMVPAFGKRPRTAPAVPVLLVLLGVACQAPPRAARPPQPPSAPPSYPWARATLAKMSLTDKIGQLIGVRATGLPRHPASGAAARLRDQVQRLKVGTVVVFESEVGTLPVLLNELQQKADLPLLVAA